MKRIYISPVTELTDTTWTEEVLVKGSNDLEKYEYNKELDIQVGDIDDTPSTRSKTMWEEHVMLKED